MKENISKAKGFLDAASQIIQGVSDIDAAGILGDGVLDRLLRSILRPKKDFPELSIYDYLLQNKHRGQLIALLRHAIVQNYSINGTVDGRPVFVSPDFHQWFEDGVVFVQGEKRFEGLMGLYQHGDVKFAITARDVRKGEQLGPNDFMFISVEEAKERSKTLKPENVHSLDTAIEQLESLLSVQNNDESQYQSLLERNPWMLGAEYEVIQSHRALDEANIPDLTGVRVRDKQRDIIEIKPPFLTLFRKSDEEFGSEFNDAWNQAERYIHFASTNADYLRKKGLMFENPKCYLLIGYDLTMEQRKKIIVKEQLNSLIHILTYNDFLEYAKSTLQFVKNLKGKLDAVST
jgi:PAS domain-containing protein